MPTQTFCSESGSLVIKERDISLMATVLNEPIN